MKKILICLLMILCLCSCDIEEEVTSSNGLKSDETKLVYSDGSKSSYVFYYEDEKITGYEVYLECESKLDASYKIQDITSGEENEDILSITQDDKYIITKYNESVYKDLTVDNITEKYPYLKKVN